MNIVGIDFSMTSTGICVELNGDSEDFYSIASGVSDKRMTCISSYGIKTIPVTKLDTKSDATSLEVEKIRRANEISDYIIELLKAYKVKFDILALENFSYGGSGRGVLDLAGFQYVLRVKLLNEAIADKFLFHPPASVKKFAIKGNAKKNEIINAYLELRRDNKLTKLLNNEDCGLLSKMGNWQKPVDDLVDSYYIKEFSKI